MNETTTAPTMEEAVAILDEVSGYQAVDDTRKALKFLRDVVDGTIDGADVQHRLNAASMLYQVATQREALALQALQIAQQNATAGEQAH